MRLVELANRLEDSLDRVVSWVQEHQYRAYEPADGNASFIFPLTRGKVLPMRVVQQLVLRAPFNVRPLIGIPPHESAIGRGYMAWGYVLMYRRKRVLTLRHEAMACLGWLIANGARTGKDFCWGDPYEYATRGGRRPYGAPLLIWSALIGQAFLDAYEVLGDEKYLRIAEGTARWILRVPREETRSGNCLSYVAYRRSSIHNANVMGAAFLARFGALTSDSEALAVAASAVNYTCSRQRGDGAWYYAEEPRFHWIDSFHTGYNLSALKTYRDATKDGCFDGCLERGRRFYADRFFEADGRPKYFDDRTYPLDIQCAAQAIETLTALAGDDPECLGLALKVAEWAVSRMQAKDGHFFYRDLGWKRVRTPMLHWGQGTMVKALAVLLAELAPGDEGELGSEGPGQLKARDL